MRMWSLICGIALAAVGCSRQSGPSEPTILSETGFRDQYTKVLRQLEPAIVTEASGDLGVKISLGERVHHAYLDNAYHEYQRDPTSLDDVLDRWAQAAVGSLRTLETEDIDLARIVPVIKDARYVSDVRQSMIDAGHDVSKFDMYHEKLNAGLDVLYALDSEHDMRYLGTADIAPLGMTPEELRDHAIANLKRILPPIERRGDNGFYLVMAGGSYEASLLLVDSLWNASNFSVQGDIVVGIPSRDVLIVTGSGDQSALRRLRELCEEEVSQASYRLTSTLFIRTPNGWEPLK